MPFMNVRGSFCIIILLVIFTKPGIAQIVDPSSAENSVVYFLRGYINERLDEEEIFNSLTHNIYISDDLTIPIDYTVGGTNNYGFFIYDSNMVVAELYVHEYIRYECEAAIICSGERVSGMNI